jgi:hypothetical protein
MEYWLYDTNRARGDCENQGRNQNGGTVAPLKFKFKGKVIL